MRPGTERAKWTLVGATGMLTGIGHGFAAYAVSVLLKPIAGELELSRATVSAAVGMGRLVAGVTAPLVGRAVDLMSPGIVVAAGMVLTSAGLAATGAVAAEWHLYFAWSLLVSMGVATAFTVALDKVVISAIRTGRGMALAVRFSVAGLATTMLMPMVGLLVEAVGWRLTCFIWAAVILALVPVPLLLFPRHVRSPDRDGMPAPAAAALSGAELPGVVAPPAPGLREAIRTGSFWIVAYVFMVQAAANTGLALHLVPLMTDSGMESGFAAGLVGGLVLLSIPVRLLTGRLADLVQLRRLPLLLGLLMLGEALFIGSYAVWPSVPAQLLMLLAIGVGTGAPTLIVLVLIARLFGERSYGAVQGSLMMLQVPGTMLAPILAGYAYDATGSYASAVAGFAVALLSGGLLLLRLRTPHA